ncbi:hypothetical protein M408DRAFT_296054 [Serendipita vermifera MAFF 305830]|uniref:Uncharacterized protein n=1 Tax=Serendipita vermifera MAFF 305830 TaxID=933852 RepID=A0A0C2XMS4_SERVB|nr:hypothetical protein M408DRAFT_296054 [Serendipita vermifera MAFF 305830]
MHLSLEHFTLAIGGSSCFQKGQHVVEYEANCSQRDPLFVLTINVSIMLLGHRCFGGQKAAAHERNEGEWTKTNNADQLV